MTMIRTLLPWFLIPILLYALMVAFVWMLQSRMVFLPTSVMGPDPASRQLSFNEVELRTDDSETIHGWFIPGPDNGPTLLFFHGNAGNISHRLDSLELFNQVGFSVFIIDYRGYGKSTGRPSEQGTYRDAQAAWEYLTKDKQLAPQDIIIFGRSLGGGVASWLATKHDARMLVLESTFESVPAIAAQIYPWLPVRWLSNIHYNTGSRIGAIKTPTTILHSIDDELIGFDHGRRLFDRAANPIEFVEMTGSHNQGFLSSGSTYINVWRRIVQGGQVKPLKSNKRKTP